MYILRLSSSNHTRARVIVVIAGIVVVGSRCRGGPSVQTQGSVISLGIKLAVVAVGFEEAIGRYRAGRLPGALYRPSRVPKAECPSGQCACCGRDDGEL